MTAKVDPNSAMITQYRAAVKYHLARALIAIDNRTCCQIFYDKKNSMKKPKNNKKTAGSNRCEFI